MIRWLVLLLTLAAPARAEIVLSGSYTEGPLWVGERLYYAEMREHRVMTWTEAEGQQVFWQQPGCGPTAIAPFGEGDFIVLCHLSPAAVQISPRGETLRVHRADATGRRLQNPNDVTVDGAGGVYFSDSGRFQAGAAATGAVMHLDRAGTLTRVAEGLSYANGVAFDPAKGRLLVSAHLGRQVLSYPVDPAGTLQDPGVFLDLERIKLQPSGYAEAGPDGIEIDRDGLVWVAEYGAGRLLVQGPAGTAQLDVAIPFVTSLAVSEAGQVAITGALDNRAPPFPSVVVIVPQAEVLNRLVPVE